MNSNLFTLNFIKVCIANLLLFFALYVVLFVTPFAVSPSLAAYGLPNWSVTLLFIAGLLLTGPLHNYFIENHGRKRVAQWGTFTLIISALALLFANNGWFILLIGFVQGLSFGFTVAASITVAIDIIPPHRRNRGNIFYAWSGRLGMVLAIPFSLYLQTNFWGYQTVIYCAIVAGMLSYILVSSTKHLFRAPIPTSILSFDRFFLPSRWRLILIMSTLAFIPGALFPHFMIELENQLTYITADSILFTLLPFIVFLISALLAHLEIDALLHFKHWGFIALRLPVLLIPIYYLCHFDGELSPWSITILILLILSFLRSLLVFTQEKAPIEEISKWKVKPKFKIEATSPIISGLLIILLVLTLEQSQHIMNGFLSYILIVQLLVFGLARVSSTVLLLFIVRSKHCERGTANSTHHLSWEVGLAAGFITTLALKHSLNTTVTLCTAVILLTIISYGISYFRIKKQDKLV